MSERVVFDFAGHNKEGLARIIYGKGLSLTMLTVFLTAFFLFVLLFLPWKIDLPFMLFRGFALSTVIYCIFQYIKTIVKVSFDNNNLYMTTWKIEKIYPLNDISQIKLTHFITAGHTLIHIRGEKNKCYILWSPAVEVDRYDLYLSMKMYIDDHINVKLKDCKLPTHLNTK